MPKKLNELSPIERCRMEVAGFTHPAFGNIRLYGYDENDNPLFVAKDVATALGYKNPRNAVNRHCTKVAPFRVPLLSEGGEQQVRVIGEGDLNRLVLHSKLPNAVEFQDWVCDEVLPSIRKQGKYVVGQQEDGGFDMEELAKEFFNKKPLEIGRTRLMAVLRNCDVLTKKNLPSQKYIERGWMTIAYTFNDSNKRSSAKAVVTQKGLDKIIAIVKEHWLDEPKQDYNPNQLRISFDDKPPITDEQWHNMQ